MLDVKIRNKNTPECNFDSRRIARHSLCHNEHVAFQVFVRLFEMKQRAKLHETATNQNLDWIVQLLQENLYSLQDKI